MINVTKEQIQESLERLRDYSQFCYFSKDSKEFFNKQTRKVNGKEYKIEILDSGHYKISNLDNLEYAIYELAIWTAPLQNGIDNLDFRMKQIECTGNIEEFKEVSIFLLSSFQRSVAFIFFARMQLETISGISEDLSKAILPK